MGVAQTPLATRPSIPPLLCATNLPHDLLERPAIDFASCTKCHLALGSDKLLYARSNSTTPGEFAASNSVAEDACFFLAEERGDRNL